MTRRNYSGGYVSSVRTNVDWEGANRRPNADGECANRSYLALITRPMWEIGIYVCNGMDRMDIRMMHLHTVGSYVGKITCQMGNLFT